MKIKYKILSLMSLLVIISTATFSVIVYNTEKKALLDGIDSKLLTAAHCARNILPDNFHDRIVDQDSVQVDEYLGIVDKYNQQCLKLDLQYLWSLMIIDDQIVFTSGTSTGKDVRKGDHALFFDVHTNPAPYKEAFTSMKTQFNTFHDKWGDGRMVLVPDYDSKGRKYLIASSMGLGKVNAMVRKTMIHSLVISVAVFLIGIVLSFILANSFSKPVTELTKVAENIALGDLNQTIQVGGSSELESLSVSINSMVNAIRDKIQEVNKKNKSLNQEILERKQAKEAQLASEERFKAAFESANDSIIIWNRDYNYLYANQASLDHVGTTRDKVIGKNIRDSLGHMPDFMKLWMSRIDQVFENGKAEKFTDTTEMQGKLFYTHSIVSPVMNERRETISVCVVYRDITDLKQAEDELKKFRTISNRAVHGNAIVDLQGNIIYINNSFAHDHGYSADELIGQNLSVFHNEKQLDAVRQINEALIQEGSYESREVWHTHKDGTEFPMLMSGIVIMDDDNNPQYMAATGINITKLKKAEKEQIRLQDQLQESQKMEAIGTLAGGIAHDFNNILAAIFGFTEVALNNVEQKSLIQSSLQEVLTAGKRAKDLIQQILTFSRQTEQERIPVQIKHIIREALQLIRSSLPTTIEIHQDIKSDPLVMGDPTQIHQIIMNLCTNAGHAMQEKGGELNVELDDLELDSEFIGTHPDIKPGRYTRLTVSDTGHGISKKVLDRIFDPFFTTKEKGEGTGLGLSVIHGIVKNYGGAINVYSEPGKGSTFKVFLPVIERKLEPETKIEQPIPKGTERILFVDDEPPVTDMAKQLLEPLGYEVTKRTSSIEALELFKTRPEAFDIVITDMTMPKMTGDELSKEILAIRPDMPIILCTGFSERITKEKAKDYGISAFALKPLLVREMALTIHEVLDKGKKETPIEGKRILVIDDEEQMRSMLRLMLEDEGFEVSEAPDGKVALWIYKEKPSDLIITDLLMPEKEGIETIMELKKNFPDVKVIAISGGGKGGLKTYLDLARKSGADSALAKPFEKEELLKAVKGLLS